MTKQAGKKSSRLRLKVNTSKARELEIHWFACTFHSINGFPVGCDLYYFTLVIARLFHSVYCQTILLVKERAFAWKELKVTSRETTHGHRRRKIADSSRLTNYQKFDLDLFCFLRSNTYSLLQAIFVCGWITQLRKILLKNVSATAFL